MLTMITFPSVNSQVHVFDCWSHRLSTLIICMLTSTWTEHGHVQENVVMCYTRMHLESGLAAFLQIFTYALNFCSRLHHISSCKVSILYTGRILTMKQGGHVQVYIKFPVFSCVHDQFPCVFQYINNKYYFYKWPALPFTAILSSILFNNNITS